MSNTFLWTEAINVVTFEQNPSSDSSHREDPEAMMESVGMEPSGALS